MVILYIWSQIEPFLLFLTDFIWSLFWASPSSWSPQYFGFQGLHVFQVESPLKSPHHALWCTSMMPPTFRSYWNEDIKIEIEKAMGVWNCSYRQRTEKCPTFQSFGHWHFSIAAVVFPAKELPGRLGKKIRTKERKGKNEKCLYSLSTLWVPFSGLFQARIRELILKPSLAWCHSAHLRVFCCTAFRQEYWRRNA